MPPRNTTRVHLRVAGSTIPRASNFALNKSFTQIAPFSRRSLATDPLYIFDFSQILPVKTREKFPWENFYTPPNKAIRLKQQYRIQIFSFASAKRSNQMSESKKPFRQSTLSSGLQFRRKHSTRFKPNVKWSFFDIRTTNCIHDCLRAASTASCRVCVLRLYCYTEFL